MCVFYSVAAEPFAFNPFETFYERKTHTECSTTQRKEKEEK